MGARMKSPPGRACVRLARNPLGHFVVRVRINGRAASLVLDTGASHTAIDQKAAARLGLAADGAEGVAGGVGNASMRVRLSRARSFQVGAVRAEDVPVAVLDLSHANAALRAKGARPVHGVLGADFLRARGALLDFASSTLHLKKV
jgi:clan AA aspartic protease (TIGR02281 family)